MAQAANLVANGGFDGGLANWAQSMLPPGESDTREILNYGDGNFYSNGTMSPTSLSQSIQTVAGTFYDLSFQLRGLSPDSTPVINYSGVLFGGTTIVQSNFDSGPGIGAFTTFTYKHLAGTGSSTPLSFTSSSDNSFVHLDNVTVQISAVPEPETYAMMLLGLGLIGYTMQRRRKA
ncbi:MAG: PEPxxWA-CTERM sorting domain-containing protein [Oxalobacteraceae bacterium]|nr:PEPxxWA-CTERM sorting domain-containing protein [Oxalobacteraceae bacterium]